MLLGKLASGFCPLPTHYKNQTLSSNKSQKLAALSSDKAEGGGLKGAVMGADGGAWRGDILHLTELVRVGGCWCPSAMSGVMTAPRMDGRFAGE